MLVYRDLSVAFVRLLAAQRSLAIASRPSGKIKAWIYAFGGISGMALVSIEYFRPGSNLAQTLSVATYVLFCLCALIAVVSVSDYIYSFLRRAKQSEPRKRRER